MARRSQGLLVRSRAALDRGREGCAHTVQVTSFSLDLPETLPTVRAKAHPGILFLPSPLPLLNGLCADCPSFPLVSQAVPSSLLPSPLPPNHPCCRGDTACDRFPVLSSLLVLLPLSPGCRPRFLPGLVQGPGCSLVADAFALPSVRPPCGPWDPVQRATHL